MRRIFDPVSDAMNRREGLQGVNLWARQVDVVLRSLTPQDLSHGSQAQTPPSPSRISKYNKEEVLEKAEKDLAAVTDQYMSRLVKELQGTDFWKLRRAYSPGVQEYVEAATFCKFCRTGTLLNLDEINASLLPLSDPSLEPLQLNILDYLLGLADLTGELMRLAIGRISDGEPEFAERICKFVREIYRELSLIVPHMDDSSDMKTKMDTMLQSMLKIENVLGDRPYEEFGALTEQDILFGPSGIRAS
ncbi:hypothetical protein GH714_028960 [Hevea brasiliensis]|uniref:Translin-associated protein X n=1 Tax=Hevea brasiliensis TaxID=3981 RepID=A0A6A6LFU6_HEVBR|nr:hypothetical protein GH714_028960 [Hevea brasiliensis]